MCNPLDCNMRTDNDISLFLPVHIEINIIYEYDHIYFSCIAQTIIYTHKLLYSSFDFYYLPWEGALSWNLKGSEGG